MSIPIPSTNIVTVPASNQVVYDRWAILSQTVSANHETGKLSLSAIMCRSSESALSNRPEDRVSIADPDIGATASTDSVLGPLLQQRVTIDLQIAKRIMEMRGIL